MTATRPFRFGIQSRAVTDGASWADAARRYESLGFSTLFLADHFDEQLAPIAAMTAAACATTTLRVGCLVFANDYRHPVVLAKELATLDVLSAGRVELGIGAGWMGSDYDEAGIPFDRPGTRVDRMIEGVHALKALFAEGPATFEGRHYRITGHDARPKPIQRPHPPILIGAGGKRMLSFAAREADIIGINLVGLGNDRWADTNVADATEQATDRKVGWIREAAGARFDDIELSVSVAYVIETDDRDALAASIAAGLPTVEGEPARADRVLASPHVLIGTTDEMTATLEERRERWGISYHVFQPDVADAVAPIVAKLAGT